MLTYLIFTSLLLWLSILIAPWRPWSTNERLDAKPEPNATTDLSDLTVLVPARNEAPQIAITLAAIANQGSGLRIILVDDQSEDGTAEIARGLGVQNLTIVAGETPPAGWVGKLWALEQGRKQVQTAITLLLDADIELKPGTMAALRATMQDARLDFVSLMAHLRMGGFWEKLLVPAFVYFFKLLYPFRLSNSPTTRFIAAAAGGCIMLRTPVLETIGGFAAIKDALIDDCALARLVKQNGFKTWIGLTHSAISQRPYTTLRSFWDMVARTAFSQLRYSFWLLTICTIGMVTMFAVPVLGIVANDGVILGAAATTFVIMASTYLPILKFYERTPYWALALPLIGTLFLAMTWSSAIRYLRGEKSRWKGRTYS